MTTLEKLKAANDWHSANKDNERLFDEKQLLIKFLIN